MIFAQAAAFYFITKSTPAGPTLILFNLKKLAIFSVSFLRRHLEQMISRSNFHSDGFCNLSGFRDLIAKVKSVPPQEHRKPASSIGTTSLISLIAIPQAGQCAMRTVPVDDIRSFFCSTLMIRSFGAAVFDVDQPQQGQRPSSVPTIAGALLG
ncbi:MAG: hypothetical protein ABSD08_02060 [Xanthobacteraceae bacterium]|jgi:hypothetical protein